MIRDLLTVVLAGGEGRRLWPLTRSRSKPAVSFGAGFRLVDFPLASCLASGALDVRVLAQRHVADLERHLASRWSRIWPSSGSLKTVTPRTGFSFLGTADAVHRCLEELGGTDARAVLVLSGDHVYRADYGEFVNFHLRSGAGVTVLTHEVPVADARAFGVIQSDATGMIYRLVEKPDDPRPFAQDGKCRVNLGVYCFDREYLSHVLARDAVCESSQHDFGRDVLPRVAASGEAIACPFRTLNRDGVSYWRDVGTVESYFDASMDLVRDPPLFELEDARWVGRSPLQDLVPRRVWHQGGIRRVSSRGCCLVAPGASVAPDAILSRCILSEGSRVHRGARLEDCVVLPGAVVGEGASLRRVIVEENARVPSELAIGFAGHGRTERGVTVFDGVEARPRRMRPLENGPKSALETS